MGGGSGLVAVFFHRFNRWTHGFSCWNRSPADDHVGQSKEHVELMPVLGKSPATHFPMPENVLHNMKRILHPSGSIRAVFSALRYLVRVVGESCSKRGESFFKTSSTRRLIERKGWFSGTHWLRFTTVRKSGWA